MKIAVQITVMTVIAIGPAFSFATHEQACASSSFEEKMIGAMVKAVSAAIDAPRNPDSMVTIVEHGTDSRYYVMIRGWLVQELRGVESQLDGARDPAAKEKLSQKVEFLRQSIRRIDLE